METNIPTKLNFIYAKNEEEKLSKFFDCVQLVLLKKEFKFESNSIEIDIKLEENYICYKEHLVFKTKTNSEISADYPIYAHKTNYIYIDFDENNLQNIGNVKLLSLEIIYQSILEELLPKNILYDGKELIHFDTFGNKLRKRIGLININAKKLGLINEILAKYPNFEFQEDFCYEVFVRIPAKKDIQYSIADLEIININGLKINESIKKGCIIDKNTMLNNLILFHPEFSSLLNKDDKRKIKAELTDLCINYSYLKPLVMTYYDNILNYANFQ